MVEINDNGHERADGVGKPRLVGGDFTNQFSTILDEKEEVIWTDKPVYIPFILSGVKFMVFGLVFAIVLYYGFFSLIKETKDFRQNPTPFYVFLSTGLIPTIFAIWVEANLILSYRNTFYALTDRRVIFRSGIFGVNFSSIDHDKIDDIQIFEGLFGKIFNVCSIGIYSGRRDVEGDKFYQKFLAIDNAHEVYKKLKSVNIDIKTDWNYPNALRPENNQGYATKYNRKSK